MVNKVRDKRLYLGLSQRELARRVGITSAAMSAIERGEHIPGVLVALLIARELDSDAEDLWGELANQYQKEALTYHLESKKDR